MKIYVTGVSGTGKTSIARALKERGINSIDIDEISHWENKASKEIVGWEPGNSDEWHKNHDWVCDISAMREALAKSEHSIALGHASNQEDYLSLFDKIFVLNCKPETIVHRITSRTDNDFGKHPEDMARILGWQKDFTSWMVAKGAEVIDAEKSVDEITDYLISLLK